MNKLLELVYAPVPWGKSLKGHELIGAAFAFSLVSSILYFVICSSFFLSITAPSDPLQYVGPALSPSEGFPYFDRLMLWYWIRLVSNLPIPPEYLGGIATLFAMSLILFMGSFWLFLKENIYSVLIFNIFFIFNPVLLGNSSYTYPMQLMSLVLLVVALLTLSIKRQETRLFVGGVGLVFSLLSKIQAWSFVFYLIYLAYRHRKKILLKDLFSIFLGVLAGAIFVVLLISIVDGFDMLVKLYNRYFASGVASSQFSGRAAGGLPPIYKILYEPAVIVSFVVLGYVFIFERMKTSMDFAVIAASQFIGLIFIYLVTQRGGPLIANYFIDFLLFSALATSIVLGRYVDDSLSSSSGRKMTRSISMLNYLIAVYFILLIVILSVNVSKYFEFKQPKWDTINYYLIPVSLASVLMAIHFFRKKYISKAFGAMVVMILIIIKFSASGVKDGYFKYEFWTPAHDLAKEVNKLDDGKRVWISVSLMRGNVGDGSWRVKTVYYHFYNREKEKDMKLYFGSKGEAHDAVITDSQKVINELSNDNGYKKRIFYRYKYSFKNEENKVWILTKL